MAVPKKEHFRIFAGTAVLAFFWIFVLSAEGGAVDPPGPDFVDVSGWDGIKLDIRYATPNNFTGRNLYGDYKRCLLHKKAAEKLKQAVSLLRTDRPGYRFLLFDCLRPRHIQKVLWDVVAGTPQAPYVANPATGSVHNFGYAIDLSLLDEKGKELDMGTAYDTFSPLSEPAREVEMLRSGRLSSEQIRNRKILRKVMETAGFRQLSNEWWHYDAVPPSEVRKYGRIVE